MIPLHSPIVCIHEDRPSHFVGVKLAILSLLNHTPSLSVLISCPEPGEQFEEWISSFPNVKRIPDLKISDLAWNIKPAILLHLLKAGYSEIIWLDSDIIVTGDILSKLSTHSHETFVATQETYLGDDQSHNFRTPAWGLQPGRVLTNTINTGLLRVTHHHIGLLSAWQTMLNHPMYIHAQTLSWDERPIHMLGDQDSLTALLGSNQFTDIPLELLKRGSQIAQCFSLSGYTPSERIESLFAGLPPLIHAMDNKPWMKAPVAPSLFSSSLREYYEYLALDLSPYTAIAKQYQAHISEDTQWMEIRSLPAKLLSMLAIGHAAMQGFLLSLVETIGRWLVRRLKKKSYTISNDFRINTSPLDLPPAD